MAISTRTCRDCRTVLAQMARGCPRCACNIEAEEMIDRFIWRRVVPCLFVAAVALVALAYLLR